MSTISIIVFALIIEYFYDDIQKYRENNIILKPFNLYQSKIDADKYKKSYVCIFFVTMILIFGMIVITIIDSLSSILFFTTSLLIILYSLRTNQYNREIEELKIKLEFKKDDIDKKLLFKLCPNLKQTRAKSNLNNLVIKNLFFNSIRNTFAIIFYFILLGAPAALAYKILDYLIYDDSFKIDTKSKVVLKKYMYYVDYIPVRITSYCLSIVSNYDQVMNKINNLQLSNNLYLSNIEFINQSGESVYDNSKKESEQIIQIQNILSRTLIAWIGIIFLLGFSGIFI